MSKNVLIISSTPRAGGNSELIAESFADGAKDAGNNVQTVRLRQKKINFCLGCGACTTTHKCVQKDDMAELLDKMVKADAIVLASPVYFYCVNGQMKTFIDRCCPRYEEISGKDFYFISVAADSSKAAQDGSIACYRAFLDCLNNPVEKSVIFGGGLWKLGDAKKSEALKRAYDAGKNV